MDEKLMIIHSQLTTPDGTTLVSSHRHDYVSHLDSNGNKYFLDGGTDYIRSSNHGDEQFLTITDEEPHKVIREYLSWGTYGKNGKGPYHRILLKDMTNDHIEAVLDYVPQNHVYVPFFKAELEFRRI